MEKILFVDDEPGLLKIEAIRLTKTGYEVFGAADGQGALDLARQKMPGLILLDVLLPVMNGDEVAKMLKKDGQTKKIPIILISANVQDLEAKCEECGAESYLGKPFGSGELVGLVKKFLPVTA